jgi:hypothetical protein
MAIVARIIGLSLLIAGLLAGLGYALFGRDLGVILLACVGAIVGAVAGAAREIVAAQRRKPEW